MIKPFKKRRTWQISFVPSAGKTTFESLHPFRETRGTIEPSTAFEFEAEVPSPLYVQRLYVSPRDCEILVMEQNGRPVPDRFNGVLNREWFARWKTPLALGDPEFDVYELHRNGVQLRIEKGDVVTLHFEKVGCKGATLIGFVEELS